MYNGLGQLSRYSEPFYFLSLGVEFAAGMARDPKTGNILVSFGKNDCQSWIASFDPNEIEQILKTAVNLSELTKNTQHFAWITNQTNRTLKNKQCIDAAIALSSVARTPIHIDAAKNWSNILALFHTFYNVDLAEPVLDVGATEQCVYLHGLYLYGYRNLISIDIQELAPRIPNVITHLQCDCTATNFNDQFFRFVNCSSVLQFGVDINNFMSEVSRILISGGYLCISVDYWQESIDTHGKEAFGVPIKIFTPSDIGNIVDTAAKCGLVLTSDLDLSCGQSAIHWLGFDYTFMNLLFKKII
jgi:SAM-dependent methyltransferase